MLGCDQAGKSEDATRADDIVVMTAAEAHAPVLDHAEPATLGPVIGMELLEPDHAVRDAVHLQVVLGGGQVVEQHDRAGAYREELLQRQDLSPVAQGGAGQQSQFGE